MSLLLPILAIFLLFSLSIFVHELGHFLAARRLGMVADVFSIGMGKALWKRKFGDTVWQVGCLPFGGFVALPQMDPNSFLEGASEPGNAPPRVLPRVAPWRKIIVSVAGAFGNVVFAFVLAAVVWIVGKPSSLQERNAVIGYVAADSSAAAAGLVPGDEILTVNGQPVSAWVEVAEKAALAPEGKTQLRVRTPAGTEREVAVETERAPVGIRFFRDIDGMDPCHVAAVFPGSGAEKAGLLPGDQILSFGGEKIYSRAHLSQQVAASEGKPMPIQFRRGGQELHAMVQATYREDSDRYLIGIQFNTIGDLDFETRSHPTPWAQVQDHATAIFRFLRALTTPSTSGAAADAVGGPVLILLMLWLMIESSFILAVWFTGFLNVNLAILNLLPIPILDGGHVVMNLYEWVTRRPPPRKLVNLLANAFAVVFIVLFLTLTFRDSVRHVAPPVRRWVTGSHAPDVLPTFDATAPDGEGQGDEP